MASSPRKNPSLEGSNSTDSITNANIFQPDSKIADPIVVKIREHTDAVSDEKVAFLDTFSPEEEKRIMRKVDFRILPLIGLMMLVKQVCVR